MGVDARGLSPFDKVGQDLTRFDKMWHVTSIEKPSYSNNIKGILSALTSMDRLECSSVALT